MEKQPIFLYILAVIMMVVFILLFSFENAVILGLANILGFLFYMDYNKKK